MDVTARKRLVVFAQATRALAHPDLVHMGAVCGTPVLHIPGHVTSVCLWEGGSEPVAKGLTVTVGRKVRTVSLVEMEACLLAVQGIGHLG